MKKTKDRTDRDLAVGTILAVLGVGGIALSAWCAFALYLDLKAKPDPVEAQLREWNQAVEQANRGLAKSVSGFKASVQGLKDQAKPHSPGEMKQAKPHSPGEQKQAKPHSPGEQKQAGGA